MNMAANKNTVNTDRFMAVALDSRLFRQLLVLILICRIRNTIQKDAVLRNLTVREVMEDIEALVRMSYSGR